MLYGGFDVSRIFELPKTPIYFDNKNARDLINTNFVLKTKTEQNDLYQLSVYPNTKYTYGMDPEGFRADDNTIMNWKGGIDVYTGGKSFNQVLRYIRIMQHAIAKIPTLFVKKDKRGMITKAKYRRYNENVNYSKITITNMCCKFKFDSQYINLKDIIKVLVRLRIDHRYEPKVFPPLRITFFDGKIKFSPTIYKSGNMIVVGIHSIQKSKIALQVIKILIAASIENKNKRADFINEYILCKEITPTIWISNRKAVREKSFNDLF